MPASRGRLRVETVFESHRTKKMKSARQTYLCSGRILEPPHRYSRRGFGEAWVSSTSVLGSGRQRDLFPIAFVRAPRVDHAMARGVRRRVARGANDHVVHFYDLVHFLEA